MLMMVIKWIVDYFVRCSLSFVLLFQTDIFIFIHHMVNISFV